MSLMKIIELPSDVIEKINLEVDKLYILENKKKFANVILEINKIYKNSTSYDRSLGIYIPLKILRDDKSFYIYKSIYYNYSHKQLRFTYVLYVMIDHRIQYICFREKFNLGDEKNMI